jgi:hypothetical protein
MSRLEYMHVGSCVKKKTQVSTTKAHMNQIIQSPAPRRRACPARKQSRLHHHRFRRRLGNTSATHQQHISNTRHGCAPAPSRLGNFFATPLPEAPQTRRAAHATNKKGPHTPRTRKGRTRSPALTNGAGCWRDGWWRLAADLFKSSSTDVRKTSRPQACLACPRSCGVGGGGVAGGGRSERMGILRNASTITQHI